jgi:hypothetical protein
MSSSTKSVPPNGRKFPLYGWVGLLILIVGQYLFWADVRLDQLYLTPVMWTGFILFFDAVNWRRGGSSWFMQNKREWPFLFIISVIIWIIFEVYNFKVKNWNYGNLPVSQLWRDFAFLWAFATIGPALFVAAETLNVFGILKKVTLRPLKMTPFFLAVAFAVGILFTAVPVSVRSDAVASALVPMMFTCFFLLLEPINYRLGAPSLFRQMAQGDYSLVFRLMLGGLLCGFLWESWNFQALQAHGMIWIYNVSPLYIIKINGVVLKYGEMPILGFLGYMPFALEYYAMYYFFKWGLQGDKMWQSDAA